MLEQDFVQVQKECVIQSGGIEDCFGNTIDCQALLEPILMVTITAFRHKEMTDFVYEYLNVFNRNHMIT